MNFRCQALRDSARDEACIACGRCDGSVVLAHCNEQMAGKGGAIKAHDLLALYLCQLCHQAYDAGRTDREACRAFFREHLPRMMIRIAEKLAAGQLILKHGSVK